MPEIGDDEPDHAEQLAGEADVMKDAWQRTLDDMWDLEAELEEEGWETFVVAAGHTAPEPPDEGRSGRYGLVHVIPDNFAEEFEAFFEAGAYPRYDVYRTTTSGRVFSVTVLLDPESERAILVASNFQLRDAAPLVNHVVETGEMYTHVQTLDGTHLGSFRHEEYEKFFPRTDAFEGFTPGTESTDAEEDD